MALLRIPEENRSIGDRDELVAYLAGLGIEYERVDSAPALSARVFGRRSTRGVWTKDRRAEKTWRLRHRRRHRRQCADAGAGRHAPTIRERALAR